MKWYFLSAYSRKFSVGRRSGINRTSVTMNARGAKRKFANTEIDSDDEEFEVQKKSTSSQRSQRSPTFQKPGPASWKKAQQNVRSQSESCPQKSGPVSSKEVFRDKKRATSQSPTSAKNLPNHLWNKPQDRRQQFIWFVRQCPNLWDPKNPLYRNKAKKTKSWEALSTMYGQPEEECRVFWMTLRNRYTREMKKPRELVAPDFRELMKNDLDFLKPIVHHRTSSQNFRSVLPTARSSSYRRSSLPTPTVSSSSTRRAHDSSSLSRAKLFTTGSKGRGERSTSSCDGSMEEGEDTECEAAQGTKKNLNAPLKDTFSELSSPEQIPNDNSKMDQLFVESLLVIFQQLSPCDKNLVLSKVLRYIVKFQKNLSLGKNDSAK